ncbi:MAG: hypothetical protein HDQ94_01540 [Desulfovibrio sp.]|nr:hypothetical protein [Desulfovibrio sp.]
MVTSDSPYCCSRCGSRNVELRDMRPGIPLLGWLADLLGGRPRDPMRHWGAKRLVCRDCGHIAILHIM